MLDASVTETPPAGALPFNVTVPVELAPPCREVGASVKLVTPSGDTVNVCERVVPLYIALITDVPAIPEVIGNVAVVLPEATKTELGTVATDVVPEDRLTVIPPAGAAAERVTVPVELVPTTTVAGLKLNAERDTLDTLPI